MTGVILSDYEVNDILNEQYKEIKLLKKENEKLKQQLTDCKEKKQQMKEFLYRNKAKGLPKDEVKETLQKRYNHLQKIQQETEKPSRYWQGAIMEIEVIADCLGVELK